MGSETTATTTSTQRKSLNNDREQEQDDNMDVDVDGVNGSKRLSLSKEEARRMRHRSAQRKYKKRLMEKQQELKAEADEASEQLNNVKEELSRKNALIDEMRSILLVQNEEIDSLRTKVEARKQRARKLQHKLKKLQGSGNATNSTNPEGDSDGDATSSDSSSEEEDVAKFNLLNRQSLETSGSGGTNSSGNVGSKVTNESSTSEAIQHFMKDSPKNSTLRDASSKTTGSLNAPSTKSSAKDESYFQRLKEAVAKLNEVTGSDDDIQLRDQTASTSTAASSKFTGKKDRFSSEALGNLRRGASEQYIDNLLRTSTSSQTPTPIPSSELKLSHEFESSSSSDTNGSKIAKGKMQKAAEKTVDMKKLSNLQQSASNAQPFYPMAYGAYPYPSMNQQAMFPQHMAFGMPYYGYYNYGFPTQQGMGNFPPLNFPVSHAPVANTQNAKPEQKTKRKSPNEELKKGKENEVDVAKQEALKEKESASSTRRNTLSNVADYMREIVEEGNPAKRVRKKFGMTLEEGYIADTLTKLRSLNVKTPISKEQNNGPKRNRNDSLSSADESVYTSKTKDSEKSLLSAAKDKVKGVINGLMQRS